MSPKKIRIYPKKIVYIVYNVIFIIMSRKSDAAIIIYYLQVHIMHNQCIFLFPLISFIRR